MRGDLPEEVRDLEDEIAGYEARVKKLRRRNSAASTTHQAAAKQATKEAEGLIKRYEEQQTNVRNNREYEAIAKEVELQRLEIQIADKKIKEAQYQIEQRKTPKPAAPASAWRSAARTSTTKKASWTPSWPRTKPRKSSGLIGPARSRHQPVEARLLTAYDRIRGNVRNGLAVVLVRRDACGGCFNTVPPQRQADIISHKKIIVCEHCGRILADVEGRAVGGRVAFGICFELKKERRGPFLFLCDC